MRMWMVQTDDNGAENFRVEVDPQSFMPIGPKLRPGQPIPAKKGQKGGFIVPPPGSEKKPKKEKLGPSIDSNPKPPRNQEKPGDPYQNLPERRSSFPPMMDLVRNKGKIEKKPRMA